MLMHEGSAGDTQMALTLAERLAQFSGGGDKVVNADSVKPRHWTEASATDLDALILCLRQELIGDRIRADLTCGAAGCDRRVDISFSIREYLAHHRPTRPRSLRGWEMGLGSDEGWYLLKRKQQRKAIRLEEEEETAEVFFRLPTVADQLAAEDGADAAEELVRRCIRPTRVSRRLKRKVETAMEAMAPCLAGELQGSCPACGTVLSIFFDPRQFCLRELRQRASYLYQDIDLLARRYHWSEADILALPQARRHSYAEMAREEAGTV
jgi:hypothetical protein